CRRRDHAMHILFVHKSFPAQFGHIANYLVNKRGVECTFCCEQPSNVPAGVSLPATTGGEPVLQTRNGTGFVPSRLRGGAPQSTHYCSRTFENAVWHSHAVYEAMKARP